MDKLREQLQISHDQGHLTDSFAEMALSLIVNTVNRYYNHIPAAERQEMVSRATVTLVKKWTLIKPGMNPKSYVTRIAYTSGMDEMRKFEIRRKKVEAVKEFQDNTVFFEQNLISSIPIIEQMGIKDGREMDRSQRAILRQEAIRQVNQNISIYKVAKFLGISWPTVKKWYRQHKSMKKKSFNYDGRDKNGHKPGWNQP